MAPIKRLYRSRDDSVVSGLCGGLGHYFNVDPVLVRLVFAGVTVFTAVGPGLVAYALGWIIVPLEPQPVTVHTTATPQPNGP